MKILVRYHDGAVPLTILPQGDWIDLCAAETVTMHAGEFRIISLGVSMQLPEGYEAHIVPRSSTFRKWGILQANSMGVIDEKLLSGDERPCRGLSSRWPCATRRRARRPHLPVPRDEEDGQAGTGDGGTPR